MAARIDRDLMLDGSTAVQGEVLESIPPRRLVITWHPLYWPELAQEPPSRVTFEIEPSGDVCRLRLLTTTLILTARSMPKSEVDGVRSSVA